MKKVQIKKILPLAITTVVLGNAVLSSGFAMSISVHAGASVQESSEKIEVLVGDIEGAPRGYTQKRSRELEKLVDFQADEPVGAVVGLNNYYAVDETIDWLEKYDVTLDAVYMWPKGESGRLVFWLKDKSIQEEITEFLKEEREPGKSCQEALDYLDRLENGEFGVFALTVTASAETLEALSTESDYVNYVDVMYNAEAEKYAKKVGKTVSYVELPSKPDSAL